MERREMFNPSRPFVVRRSFGDHVRGAPFDASELAHGRALALYMAGFICHPAKESEPQRDEAVIVNTGGPFFNVVRNGEVLTKRTIKGRDAAIAWAEERGLTVID